MALTVLEVLKVLPRTNCGDCGQSTCMAFATQVVKEGEDFSKCPHLSDAALRLADAVKSQQEQGLGRRRESLAIALEVMHAKVAPLDLATVAPGLGLEYGEEGSEPFVHFPYFGHTLRVFKNLVEYPTDCQENPWDAILLYNYIASQGRAEQTGTWITFQSLPNSVSKTKTMERLQRELADHFAGRGVVLKERAAALGGKDTEAGEDAEVKTVFRPLPRVPVLLLFWDADADEGFAAQSRMLFDSSVSHFLDLESLLFLVEQLQERLMAPDH